jgi:hypothetical protein
MGCVCVSILLCWRRPRMVGVGEFEQFDGRAVFDYERDADAIGWAVHQCQVCGNRSGKFRALNLKPTLNRAEKNIKGRTGFDDRRSTNLANTQGI